MYEFEPKSAYGDREPMSRATVEFEDIDSYETLVSAIVQNCHQARSNHEGGPLAIEIRRYDGDWEVESRRLSVPVMVTARDAGALRAAARRLATLTPELVTDDQDALRGALVASRIAKQAEQGF